MFNLSRPELKNGDHIVPVGIGGGVALTGALMPMYTTQYDTSVVLAGHITETMTAISRFAFQDVPMGERVSIQILVYVHQQPAVQRAQL